MRKLKGTDVFTVASIIKKAKIKESLAEAIASGGRDYNKIGINAFLTLIEGCGNEGVGESIFTFLDDILEVHNTGEVDLFELINLMKEFGEKNDLKRFLSLVVGSTV